MILDARRLDVQTPLHADLCIVGAGPAGIAIARHCAAQGMVVLLLEAGGRSPDAASQALCRGELAGPNRHPPPDQFRRRALGGSTAIWGGRCAPMDSWDFAERPWLGPKTGWPIGEEDLLPHWAEAAALLDLGSPDFRANTAVPQGMKPLLPGFQDPDILTGNIERFSPPRRFGAVFAAELARCTSILVLLHAVCTRITLGENLRRVSHIDVQTLNGRTLRASAQEFVLAAGGLEVPRLLLSSNHQLPGGVGNEFDQVGRHYMCHLAGTTGVFQPRPGVMPWHGYERDADGVYLRRRLSVAPHAQKTWRIGNVIARLQHPRIGDPSHGSGPLSALHLARHVLPAEYALRLADETNARRALHHAANIARDPAGTATFLLTMLRRRRLSARKFPSVVLTPPSGAFTLDMHAEQLPNPDSRVTLGQGRDCFGTPQVKVDWRMTEADLRSIRVTIALIARAMTAGRHGTLTFDPRQVDCDMLRDGAYGGHHLGGARMTSDQRTGVVDRDCRLHGLTNLYVAGGAVFPTSSQANPTFTILLLALRLAHHLAERHAAARAPAVARKRAVTA